jgi:DNA polymerase III delta subunit
LLLIIGGETALREETLAAVRAAACPAGASGLNWIVMHGPASLNDAQPLEPAAFLDEVCTSSMFGEPDELKVVVVRQADVFLANKDYREKVERNMENIPASAVLILEAATCGQFKATRFFKTLLETKAVVECDPLIGKYGESPDLEIEVAKRARARGLNLTPEAMRALMERSARSLSVLDEELGKLALALGGDSGGDSGDMTRLRQQSGSCPQNPPPPRIPVSAEDVAEICAETRTYGAFDFADALVEGNRKRAMEVLGAIFLRGIGDALRPGRIVTNEGSIAMLIFGAVGHKLSQLQDLRAALDAGQREDQAFVAAKVFGLSRRQSAQRALRRHSAVSVRYCLDALFRANIALRRSGLQPQEVVEQLAWEVATAVK